MADSLSGLLSGKTITIKDNIVTRESPTSAASDILRGFTSPFEATVVALLRSHGATINAKSNLDEFGMGSHSQNSAMGPVENMYSRGGAALSPGGSSGGSAVAVASKQAWAALGTDTGGSVRLPAAYTGITGFKPSYGLLSRWGVIQYANSLDTVGILAQNVQDACTIFELLDRYDRHDPTSLPTTLRQVLAVKETSKSSHLRIGVPAEYNIEELSAPVRSAFTRTLQGLQSLGHTIVPVSLPSTRQALGAYYVLAPAEASSNLAKYDGVRYGTRATESDATPAEQVPLYARSRGAGLGAEVQRRILLGAYSLSSEAIDNYFIQAQKVRRKVQQDFDRVFKAKNPLMDSGNGNPKAGVDVLVVPTAPTLPPTIDEVRSQPAVESYMNDVFTVPGSLAGLPAISVPVRLMAEERQGMEDSDVQSVGMQVLAQYGDDRLVLEAARTIEQHIR